MRSVPFHARLDVAQVTTDRPHRDRPSLKPALLGPVDQPSRSRRIARMHTGGLVGDAQMPQDGVDHSGIHQHADQLERPLAAGTEQRVDLVDPAHEPRPTGAARGRWRLVGGVRLRRGRAGLRLLPRPPCSSAAVGA